MGRLRRYIVANFSLLFFSIFLPLFAISSVIFMIKLAKITSVIHITLNEMVKLYIFSLPEILFYIMPITFFIAAALSLHKLSSDNESIVLFALGIRPNEILRMLFVPALLLSILLSFNFFVMFPHTKILSKNFINFKKSEAKFNLSASEFGHNFGNWLLYIGKDNKDGSYGDVYLFNKEKNDEILIGAEKAEVINKNGLLKLQLVHGEGYSYSESSLSQMNFDMLHINDLMHSTQERYISPFQYWFEAGDQQEKRTHQMLRNVMLALLPIMSLMLVMSIGIVHARHHNSHIYLYIFLTLLLYFILSIGIEKELTYTTVPLIIMLWSAGSYLIYRKKVLARF